MEPCRRPRTARRRTAATPAPSGAIRQRADLRPCPWRRPRFSIAPAERRSILPRDRLALHPSSVRRRSTPADGARRGGDSEAEDEAPPCRGEAEARLSLQSCSGRVEWRGGSTRGRAPLGYALLAG